MTAQRIPASLVVGLGKSGVSAVRWLVAHGVPVRATDSRESPPGLAVVEALLAPSDLFLGRFAEEALEGVEQVVLSPGLPRTLPLLALAAERGLPVVGDLELFALQANAAGVPVVGVTGTNGKSTVTTLVGEMAREAGVDAGVGGNLGEPALDLLRAGRQLYVVELSSYQLESCPSLRCAAATVLNVSPDHLDRYGTMEAYAAAKARIFANAGVAVVNADDTAVAAMPAGHRVTFSLRSAADYRVGEHAGEEWLFARGEAVLPVAALRIPGLHNAANALAAWRSPTPSVFPAAHRSRSCVNSRVCRTARSGSANAAGWFTSTTRRARISVRRSRQWTACAVRWWSSPAVMAKGRTLPRWPPRFAARYARPSSLAAMARRWLRHSQAPVLWKRASPCRKRFRPQLSPQSRVTSCCCRPLAPASTCSRTTRIAVAYLRRRSGSCPHDGRPA